MPTVDLWRPLFPFRDSTIPKLNNLRIAQRAGLKVPETYWASAADLEAKGSSRSRPPLVSDAWIVRSGSQAEDTSATSNAGRFLSLTVTDPDQFDTAVEQVVDALPQREGRPLGVVFVQPLVQARTAGVTFFDGFYFEETRDARNNHALTSGARRGDVRLGHVLRGNAHHAWLVRLHSIFGGIIDVEWASSESSDEMPVLLQVRPALFPIRRNEMLSLANHKEMLGDPPSPWITGVLAEVGHPILSHFASVDPAMAGWDEPYAIELANRPWMNFSSLFRLMDHWGLPRTMISEGVGGESGGPEDGRIIPKRLIRKLPTVVHMAVANFITMASIGRGLRKIDLKLTQARTLLDLQRANVSAFRFSIRTNFAIMGVLSVASKLRRVLGFRQAARVITHRMMSDYSRLAAQPDLADRFRDLDAWLARFGHRGPLESDPCQPRFIEMRDQLRKSLSAGPLPVPRNQPRPSALRAALGRIWFLSDEVRERFRDQLMKWWQRLRERILEEAGRAVDQGYLARADDVFYLRSDDLAAPPLSWRDRVIQRRQEWEEARLWRPPNTATRHEIMKRLDSKPSNASTTMAGSIRGIGVGQSCVRGIAVKVERIGELLHGQRLPEAAILVVETLEPSWAVVFPRFAAVVADLGGELSHAAILLREAGVPTIVNARGVYQAVNDGDLLSVDAPKGLVSFSPQCSRHERAGRTEILS